MRIPMLAVVVLCLTGCFAFDNPFDTSSQSVVTFQIVINSLKYAGTYLWNAEDAAYEATVNGVPHYVFMDANYLWCLATALGQSYSTAICYCPSPQFRALPLRNGTSWSPSDKLTSVDVSAGGISAPPKPPDGTVTIGDTLQVTFASTISGVGANYLWQGSSNVGITSPTPLGTGSTYHIVDASHPWIRVTITPTDGAGNVIGPPVTSPPVHVS
jgi:hypothetical protein